ncbi:MAG: adenosylcobinamide-GDP ribazoletransferase [Chloroflexota bacterium]
MQTLLAAFKYLTIWNFFATPPAVVTVGKAAVCFPLIGLLMGLALAFANYLLAPYLHPEILSVVLITLLIALTGGLHLEGLNHTFAHLAAKTRTTARENNALGFTALLLVTLFKIAAADSMDEKLVVSLLLTPVLARWALVVFLYGYPAGFEETPRFIAAEIRLWHLLVGTMVTLALTVYLLGRKGLWIGLAISLFVLLMRSLLYRRHGVLTNDHVGAVVELGEALSLVLLASL